MIHLAVQVQAPGQAPVPARVHRAGVAPITDDLFIRGLMVDVIISIAMVIKPMYLAVIAAKRNCQPDTTEVPFHSNLKDMIHHHQRDRLLLGLIIVAVIAMWKLVAWLIS